MTSQDNAIEVVARLTKAQEAVLRECASPDNRMGRIGWPLSDWESVAQPVCQPLIDAGLLEFRRLGGYPGVRITPAGRSALNTPPVGLGKMGGG